MKTDYLNNIYILEKTIIEELEKGRYVQKLSIGAKAAYKGIIIMFIGFFFKIFWNRFEPAAYIANLYEIVGWIFLFTCFLIAVIQFDKAYHYTVDREFKNSQWLKYIGIPMLGQAKKWSNEIGENYEFVDKVDFTVLKTLLDKDYIRYIIFYEELLKEREVSFEQRKYMLMMNLLAALKEESGFINKLEKCLLAKKLEKVIHN